MQLTGQPNHAVVLYKLQISLWEQIIEKGHLFIQMARENLAKGLGNLAYMAQMQMGMFAAAEHNLEYMLRICDENLLDFLKSVAHQEWGHMFVFRGEWRRADKEFSTTIQYNTIRGDYEGLQLIGYIALCISYCWRVRINLILIILIVRSEGLRMGAEVFHSLKKVLKERGLSTAVGDEGGFAPKFDGTEDALDTILKAINAAGYKPGSDITIALDCAASEFYSDGMYNYSKFEGPKGARRTSKEQVDYIEQLISKYPIDSVEDGMAEGDWDGWKLLTDRIGKKCQIVGDDVFVTNVDYLKKGIDMGCANSILIKVNQIGSLTETLNAIEMAHRAGYTTVTSHRSGETEDTTIADIAVATNSGQIKTGSASRTDRIAKYNQLLRIEETLGNLAVYGYKK